MGCSTSAHMYIRRFKLEDIPKDDEGSAQWLSDLYLEKDQLLESFHTTGKFVHDTLPSYPGVTQPPRPYTLGLSLAVNSCVVIPLTCVLLRGSFATLFTGIVVVGLAVAGIKYFIGITQISNSSGYKDKNKE